MCTTEQTKEKKCRTVTQHDRQHWQPAEWWKCNACSAVHSISMGQEHNASATAFGTAYIEGDESVICHNERAQTCHNQFLSVRKRVLLARQGNNVCGIRNRHASSSYCYNYFSKLLLTLTVKLPHLKDTKNNSLPQPILHHNCIRNVPTSVFCSCQPLHWLWHIEKKMYARIPL